METKKVIEQERWDSLEIDHSNYYGGFVSIDSNNTEEIRIEKSKAREVALAIDPTIESEIKELRAQVEFYDKLKRYLQNQLDKMRQLVEDGVQNDIQQIKTKITINAYKDILETLNK